MAATLACGEGALLCGRAAAHLFQLIRTPPFSPEVVAPTERRVPGIRTHRRRQGPPPPATRWRGIPATTIPRTLIDLAANFPPPRLARAVHEAQVKYGMTPHQVEAVLPLRAPGNDKLRAVLHGDEPVTLSALEERFLQLLEKHGLPLPITNRRAGAHHVDCRWPDHHLTVELDSYRYHHTRHAWKQGHERERAAHARGDQFRRYTWEDAFENPSPMLAELSALLRP